jgi:hypothetical protein
MAITATLACAVQPKLLDPVTLYPVGVAGETTITELVAPPGDQVYERPPLAVKVALSPEQVMLAEVAAVIVGLGFTGTVMVKIPAHTPLVPITV